VRGAAILWLLRAIQAWDRVRLAWLHARHRGLRIDPAASTNFASAEFRLAPGARLGLRSDVGTVRLVAFAGGCLELEEQAFLNGALVSAKAEVRVGRRSMIGPGSRVYDADQHDFDDAHPERVEPVHVGDHVWIASDVTVMRGVSIGDHCVVGARSVVTRSLPAHTLAHGAPARPAGPVGDRLRTR
jgi:acetyltransferase-like isoleucine patch superfamily enzyme